jgi:uncharacterized protein YnzC (UPF0291/DUF896 family)
MKIAVFLLGAGGSGKTTSRISFCGANPVCERVIVPGEKENARFFYTLYDSSSVAGNISSGTDANTSPDLIRRSFYECLKHRDVVVVDGVMGSPRFVEMVNDYQDDDMHVILVHFNLSQDAVIGRLMKRRSNNGIAEQELPEKTLKNSIAFSKRAVSTLEHFRTKCSKKMTKIEVVDSDTTDDIVRKIKQEVESAGLRKLSRSSHG